MTHFSSQDFLGDVKLSIKRRGIRLSDFAKTHGYTREGFSRLLHGKVRLDTETLNALSTALQLDLTSYLH
jgi:transcriptional regulator with XRE-family HTH domain